MSDSGTIKEDNTLSIPKSEQEYFDLVNKAVSEGNTEEVDRLMTLEWEPSPDAKTEKQDEPKAAEEAAEEKKTEEPEIKQTEEKVEDELKAADTPPDDKKKQEDTPPVETAEEKLVKLEAELQRLRSNVGRVDSLQSRLALLEKQDKTAAVVEKAIKPEKPVESEADKAIKKRIEQLREVDPDTAQLLQDMRDEQLRILEERVLGTTSTLTETLNAQHEEERLVQEFDKVMEVHPDFDQIRKHLYWHRWKDSLTPAQRAWAESSNSAEVVVAVNAFKEAMAGYQKKTEEVQVKEEPSPVEKVDDAAAQAREQRLKASTATKETPIKNTSAPDANKMFSEMYNQSLRDAGIKN